MNMKKIVVKIKLNVVTHKKKNFKWVSMYISTFT